MEDYVTSKEYSEKLQEVGFKTDTVFWWMKFKKPSLGRHWFLMCDEDIIFFNDIYYIPAYTFQQLWKILSQKILTIDKVDYEFVLISDYIQLQNVIEKIDHYAWFNTVIGYNLADTAAEAILWCIKEGYIKL